jgi:hypothetical protein
VVFGLLLTVGTFALLGPVLRWERRGAAPALAG